MVDYLCVVFSAASGIASGDVTGTLAHRLGSSSKRSARAAGLSYTHAALAWRSWADSGSVFCEAGAVHPEGVRVIPSRRYDRERAEETKKRTYHFIHVVNLPANALAIAKAFSDAQVGQPYAWLPSYFNFTPLIGRLLPMGLTRADASEWERALERAPLVTVLDTAKEEAEEEEEEEDEDPDEKDALLVQQGAAPVLGLGDLFSATDDEWDQASGSGAKTMLPIIVKPWICSEFVLAALLAMRVLHADDFRKHPCLYSPDELHELLLDLGETRFVFDNPI